MSMKKMIIPLATDGTGAATANGERSILGKLFAIEYRPGTIDTGATITITCENVSSKPLLTKANAGISNAWFYPRDLVHAVADGAALTGTSGGDREKPILAGIPRVVVASGGATKAGSAILFWEE